MKQLIELFEKKTRMVIGLMSGTSIDGIDAAIVEISGSGTGATVRQIDFITVPFPDGFKELVLRNSQTGTSDVADISRINFLLAQFYADAVHQLCEHAGVDIRKVDLIGSHGQTIHHLPRAERMFGRNVSATFQIGDPSVLAKLTGVVTVGDFRVGDVALGGQGAPLVPYFDYILFKSDKKSRALLNLGGIGNISYLPRGCQSGDVVAFDTGPGNMVIDQMMKRIYGKDFDEGGTVASAGKVLGDMIDWLMTDEFVRMSPPKSTGRERYGETYVTSLLENYADRQNEDIIATVSEFTALSVYANYLLFLKTKGEVEEIFVSGGGAHNNFILNSLRHHFVGARVDSAENIGISSDAKEAVCFAVLANELINGNPTNLPSVTGASGETLLGKICLP